MSDYLGLLVLGNKDKLVLDRERGIQLPYNTPKRFLKYMSQIQSDALFHPPTGLL